MTRETIGLLARMMDAAEVGDAEVEGHLKAHGWEWVSGRYRSPDELRAAPTCRHCGEKFIEDERSCHAKHEPVEESA